MMQKHFNHNINFCDTKNIQAKIYGKNEQIFGIINFPRRRHITAAVLEPDSKEKIGYK